MHGGKLLDGVVPPHADGRAFNRSSTTAPRPDEIVASTCGDLQAASVFLSVGRQALIGGTLESRRRARRAGSGGGVEEVFGPPPLRGQSRLRPARPAAKQLVVVEAEDVGGSVRTPADE